MYVLLLVRNWIVNINHPLLVRGSVQQTAFKTTLNIGQTHTEYKVETEQTFVSWLTNYMYLHCELSGWSID